MNKKGFTLIELLAIIVILAIIAVITVPIILNIIENSRVGAAQDSAYGYRDAVEKYYVSELFDNKNLKLDGLYSIKDGKLKGSNLPSSGVEIPLDGTVPTGGMLKYDDSIFTSGCIVVGDYAVSFASDGAVSTVKGDCVIDISSIIDTLPGVVADDGYKYIDKDYVGAHPVYFNPTDPSMECTADNSTSTVGTTTGCLKWYAYSVKDDVVNMILDHNINPSQTGVAWVNYTDYNNSSVLGPNLGVTNMGNGSFTDSSPYCSNCANHDKGPLTALNYLKTNTSNWQTSVMGDYGTYTANIPTASYTINYSTYKARLLTSQEVANIKNETYDEVAFYNLPRWLQDDTSQSYWTASPTSYATSHSWSWAILDYYVDHEPYLGSPPSNIAYGVRPVINVSVSAAFLS